jgi:hypothetical protein
VRHNKQIKTSGSVVKAPSRIIEMARIIPKKNSMLKI